MCHVTSRDFVIRESLGIMGEFSSSKVTTLQIFVIIGFMKEEILSFYFLNTFSQITRCHGLMWYHVWVSLIIRHYPATFGGHKSCRKGDILFLICHVSSRDHVVRWSSGTIDGCFSSYITTAQMLCQFLLKIIKLTCNDLCWPVACIDLWLVSPESQTALENLTQVLLMSQLSFYISSFWLLDVRR